MRECGWWAHAHECVYACVCVWVGACVCVCVSECGWWARVHERVCVCVCVCVKCTCTTVILTILRLMIHSPLSCVPAGTDNHGTCPPGLSPW